MKAWLHLRREQRINTLNVVNEQTGLPKAAIEKDWWVSLALKALFTSAYSDSLVFKGGTSLSKAWQLIERFSEDLDLVIDKDIIGFDDGAYSKTRVKKLKRAACAFISNELKQSIADSLEAMGIPPAMYHLEAAEVQDPDKDPQQLYLTYEPIEEQSDYLEPRVIIEVSARSLMEPAENRKVQSLICAHFADQAFAGKPFEVPSTMPKRTFIEKVLLLHEEFQKPDDKVRSARMTRHLYDLEKMMDLPHGQEALEDRELYNTIVEHRKVFNLLTHVNHDRYHPEDLTFIPHDTIIAKWETDYKQMQESMFYGETLPFDQLIDRMQELTQRLRKAARENG